MDRLKNTAARAAKGGRGRAAACAAALLAVALLLASCAPAAQGPADSADAPAAQTETPADAPAQTGGDGEAAEANETAPLDLAGLWALLDGVWVNRDDPGGELLFIRFYTDGEKCMYTSGVFSGDDETTGTATALRHVSGDTYVLTVHYGAVKKTADAPARDARDEEITLDAARAAGEDLLFAEDIYATTDYNEYKWAGASMETAKFSYFG